MKTTSKKNFCVNGINFKLIQSQKRWYIEWYEVKGVTRIRKKIYAGINRLPENERYTAAIEAVKKYLSPNGYSSILMDALEARKDTFRRKTYLSKKTRVNYFLLWLKTKNITDAAVNTHIANEFILYLYSKKKATATIKSYMNTLSALYNVIGDDNPFKGCIKVSVNSKSLDYFSTEDKNKIVDYLRHNNPTILLAVQLIYSCYIRPGELRLLQWSDINTERGYIELRPEVSKNKKWQKVVIPGHLLRTLIERKKSRNVYVIGGKIEPVGLNWLYNSHRKVLNKLGIKGRLSLYSWKHSGVVDAVRAGINIKDIQLQLRHHSLDMVNVYLSNLGVLDSLDLKQKLPSLI